MANSTSKAIAGSTSHRLASIISNWIQPAAANYVILFILLIAFSGSLLAALLYYVIAATCMITLPTLYVIYLLRRRRVQHVFLPVRQQRTGVYLLTVACCVLAYLLLRYFAAPPLVAGFMLATAVNTLFMTLINLSWKISGHTAGLTAPLVALSVGFGWITAPLYILVPLVAWSRVVLGAHTTGQVIAGSLLGIALTWLQLVWLYPLLHLM